MSRRLPRFSFLSTARDGSQSVWSYEVEAVTTQRPSEWQIRAYPMNPPYDGPDWYELTVTELDAESVQITSAVNYLPPRFVGRGVAPALYVEIARHLRKRLLSSREIVPGTNEFRTPRTTEIWRHLVQKGEATELPSEGRFAIDGRVNTSSAGVKGGRPVPLIISTPTNDAEFNELMEQVDETIRNQNIPIVGRALAGESEVSRLLAMTTFSGTDDGDPLPGVYEGIDLSIRIKRWFTERYGTRLNMDFSTGAVAILLKGDIWVMELPTLIGRYVLFASSTLASDSGTLREDVGPPSRFNVLDSIADLPDGLRRVLTQPELDECLAIFGTALGAYRALRDCFQQRFVPEVLADHVATVHHLRAKSPHPAQARWSAMQAVEKIYKAYLAVRQRKVPRSGHDLHDLRERAFRAGLERADQYFIDSVQCSAGMRYGEMQPTKQEAILAHHSALELTHYIADAIRETRKLPRRPF